MDTYTERVTGWAARLTHSRAARLSPLLLMAAVLQPTSCDIGPWPALTALEIEVSGDDQLDDFRSSIRTYEVETRGDTMVVRAETAEPLAEVSYQLEELGLLFAAGVIGIGGGEVTVPIPIGRSTLTINVISEGKTGRYEVALARGRTFPCTEQGVVNAVAVGGGPHAFDCDGPTTVVARTEMVPRYDVMLDGEGNLSIEGAGRERLFFVGAGVTAELAHMALSNGSADDGGALYNEGRVELVDVRVASNEASERGGGIYSGPGSELVLEGATIEANTASGTSEAAGGGLYLDDTTAFIRNSTVENNVARGRSGTGGRRARGGGLFVSGGTLAVEGSRIDANSAIGGDGSGDLETAGSADGGGLHLINSVAVFTDSAVSGNESRGGYAYRGGGLARGGGILLDGGALRVEGTTIANNLANGITGPWEAGYGGGLMIYSDSSIVAVNSTISGNRADFYEALFVAKQASAAFYSSTMAFNSTDESRIALSMSSGSEVTLSHTIVANAGRCVGSVRSLGHNLFGPNFTCSIEGDAVGDVTDADPQLQPLADNGGPTMTHALSETSPALEAGDPAGCTDEPGEPLTSDQRGATRPIGICDIGAVEMPGW